MEKVSCPCCGFPAHALCSVDGHRWRYICERPSCKLVFEI